MHGFRNTAILSAAALLAFPVYGATESAKVEQRLQEANEVLTDMMESPKGINPDLLAKAHCVVVVPGLKKGAFIVGAEWGRGFMSCRNSGEAWSAPAAIRIEGGSFGLEVGASEKDLILMVMNQEGKKRLLESQFTLGGEGEVAAGPVGRTASAQTDGKFSAGILSWSRSRGAFAGVALKGATLRQDMEWNEALYGKKIENREIVNNSFRAPATVRSFQDVLTKYSPSLKVS